MRASSSETAVIFAEWLNCHGGIPIKIARSFATQPEDQRDLLQEMHLQIWRSIEGFAAQAKASTWIYRVCLNTAMTWQRSEKRRRLFFQSIDPLDLSPNESEVKGDSRLDALYSAIRELRILLSLEERSYREIAEITGLTETNTGVRLQRVRHELARRLNQDTTND